MTTPPRFSTLDRLRAALRSRREAAGVSQSELARRLGVNRSTVHDYESTDPGRQIDIPVGRLDAIGDAIGIRWALLELPAGSPSLDALTSEQIALLSDLIGVLPRLDDAAASEVARFIRFRAPQS